jgi:hypothetical protein
VDGGWRGGETGVEKQRQEAMGMAVGGSCGLEWSARSKHGRSVVRTGQLTGGPIGFDIFLKLSKPTQTWKLNMDALLCSKNAQILHAPRVGHCEQLSKLF